VTSQCINVKVLVCRGANPHRCPCCPLAPPSSQEHLRHRVSKQLLLFPIRTFTNSLSPIKDRSSSEWSGDAETAVQLCFISISWFNEVHEDPFTRLLPKCRLMLMWLPFVAGLLLFYLFFISSGCLMVQFIWRRFCKKCQWYIFI